MAGDRKESGLLARNLDSELQEYVAEAAKEAEAPIALVSLVLEHSQFFRAHHGLPDELAIARTTARSNSFCQFVVRDGTSFEVTDATTDQRVPTDLVERYNIRSYYGVPVMTDGEVVGSLCVIDTVPREFPENIKARIADIGAKASERLQALSSSREHPHQRLIQRGLSPAFSEVRNMMTPLKFAATGIRQIAVDLGALSDLLNSDLTEAELSRVLAAQAPIPVDALQELAGDLETAYERLEPALAAIQVTGSESGQRTSLSQLVCSGLELAHHATKLVGGVDLGEVPLGRSVRCPVSLGAALVSVTATLLASSSAQSKLRCNVTASPSATVTIETVTPLSEVELEALVAEVTALATDVEDADVARSEAGVRLTFH